MTITHTCRNCDRPIPGWSTYCSHNCEEMDRHPAPRDDQEAMTVSSPRIIWVVTFGPSFDFEDWSGGTCEPEYFATQDEALKHISNERALTGDIYEYDMHALNTVTLETTQDGGMIAPKWYPAESFTIDLNPGR